MSYEVLCDMAAVPPVHPFALPTLNTQIFSAFIMTFQNPFKLLAPHRTAFEINHLLPP